MKVTIDELVTIKPNAFNGLTKTTFKATDGGIYYIFTKPDNMPNVKQEFEGEAVEDQWGKMKFVRSKPATITDASTVPATKSFKADPDKMAQDKNLAVATNMSIQRQVAVKAVTDLIVAGKVAYSGLHAAYSALMELLTEPNWRKFMDEDVLPDDEDITDEAITKKLDEVYGDEDEPFTH